MFVNNEKRIIPMVSDNTLNVDSIRTKLESVRVMTDGILSELNVYEPTIKDLAEDIRELKRTIQNNVKYHPIPSQNDICKYSPSVEDDVLFDDFFFFWVSFFISFVSVLYAFRRLGILKSNSLYGFEDNRSPKLMKNHVHICKKEM